MTQRRIPIRSKALRRAAAGQPCTLEFPGTCSHNPETTVLAHIHDETFGKGMKADDTSGVHACHSCHMAYDLHRTELTEAAVLWYVLRALQRTIRNLVERGIIVVPIDAPTGAKTAPVRKPKAERKPIPARANPWPKRKFQANK